VVGSATVPQTTKTEEMESEVRLSNIPSTNVTTPMTVQDSHGSAMNFTNNEDIPTTNFVNACTKKSDREEPHTSHKSESKKKTKANTTKRRFHKNIRIEKKVVEVVVLGPM